MAADAFELDEHPACRIAGRLAKDYDVGRRSHVADISRAFSHLTLIFVAREIRAAGTAARGAAG